MNEQPATPEQASATQSQNPHAGFASAERHQAAKDFLKAHAVFGALGSFVTGCLVAQHPLFDYPHVVAASSAATIMIPRSFDRFVDQPVGPDNPLCALILKEAGAVMLKRQTAARTKNISLGGFTRLNEDALMASVLDSAFNPGTGSAAPVAANPAGPFTDVNKHTISKEELLDRLNAEGLGDIADKLSLRREGNAPTPSIPVPPTHKAG